MESSNERKEVRKAGREDYNWDSKWAYRVRVVTKIQPYQLCYIASSILQTRVKLMNWWWCLKESGSNFEPTHTPLHIFSNEVCHLRFSLSLSFPFRFSFLTRSSHCDYSTHYEWKERILNDFSDFSMIMTWKLILNSTWTTYTCTDEWLVDLIRCRNVSTTSVSNTNFSISPLIHLPNEELETIGLKSFHWYVYLATMMYDSNYYIVGRDKIDMPNQKSRCCFLLLNLFVVFQLWITFFQSLKHH